MGLSVTRCLLVDDDDEIRSSVAEFLKRFGLTVEVAADGGAMRELLGPGAAALDIVVLDIMLPDESGLDLCRWLRSKWPKLPVIMLTAQGDPGSRVLGLELGADDYVGKPFEPRELVARINAVVRRSRSRSSAAEPVDVVRFEGWRFDRLGRHLVSPAGVVLALSSAEFRLLSAFIERPRLLLSRERLLDLTRAAGAEVSDRSVDLAVSRLRTKLGDSPREPRLIRTVRGEGYVFEALVEV